MRPADAAAGPLTGLPVPAAGAGPDLSADNPHQADRLMIPGQREPGMLTTYLSAVGGETIPQGPTMDAATIAERQREGGGAPSQRRSAVRAART